MCHTQSKPDSTEIYLHLNNNQKILQMHRDVSARATGSQFAIVYLYCCFIHSICRKKKCSTAGSNCRPSDDTTFTNYETDALPTELVKHLIVKNRNAVLSENAKSRFLGTWRQYAGYHSY